MMVFYDLQLVTDDCLAMCPSGSHKDGKDSCPQGANNLA